MLARVRSNVTLPDLWQAAIGREDGPAELLENAFAERFEFPHALFFTSARSALRALLGTLGWRRAEVLSPAYICAEIPYTITASGNCVKFVDSATGHFLPGPREWHSAITPNTKMAIITPLFGYPVDPECQRTIRNGARGVFVLSDEAQSYGAQDTQGLQLRDSDAALFSLGLGKMVTAITGGMLLLRDPTLHIAVARYRNAHFKQPDARHIMTSVAKAVGAWIAFREPALSALDILGRRLGIVAREVSDSPADFKEGNQPTRELLPSELQARLGLRQFAKLDHVLSDRRRVGQYYEARLYSEGFRTFSYVATPTWPRYPLAVANRDATINGFRSGGAQISRFLPYSCAELSVYQAHTPSCPNASLWARSMINLPSWQGLQLRQAELVINVLLSLRDKSSGSITAWPTDS